MPKVPLLAPEEIDLRLISLDGWSHSGSAIAKTYRRKDFREVVDLLTRIVGPADEQNHHPDVQIHWNELTLTLWTHASGGLTERDFRLAATIDQLAGN